MGKSEAELRLGGIRNGVQYLWPGAEFGIYLRLRKYL